jgi:hypothetical protein
MGESWEPTTHPFMTFMKWWYRVAIVYRAVMMLLFLAAVCEIAIILWWDPPQTKAPVPHGWPGQLHTKVATGGVTQVSWKPACRTWARIDNTFTCGNSCG